MASNSLLKLCLVISILIHFSLTFFPFFTLPPAHQVPAKFVEVVFLKDKKFEGPLENKKVILKNSPEETEEPKAKALAFNVSFDSSHLRVEACRRQKENYDEVKLESEKLVVAECLELDLNDFKAGDYINLYSNYAQVLRACIINNIDYPKVALRNNIEGKVQLKFVLLPDGNLKDVYIIQSSNSIILDEAALGAIEKATPFPPFPKNLKVNELFVKVPIVYKLN